MTPERHGASSILALGGIALVAAGMVVGEIYAIYISHVANGLIRDAWSSAIAAAADGRFEAVQSQFELIGSLSAKRGRTMNLHSHMAAYGLLALVLASVQPLMGLSGAHKRWLAAALLTGALLHTTLVYASYYAGGWALYAGDVGALLVILTTAGMLLGFRRQAAGSPSIAEHLAALLAPPSSRFLTRAGLLLILCGLVFGLYFAWQLVDRLEPGVYRAMDESMAALAASDVNAAQQRLADFKTLQSRIAITAAAHSHAIEFGILMLLLGLVQRYVYLQDTWRLRWARLIAIGAFALPVCVFFAARFGLRAAAFADLSGALVLAGLLAMAVGLVRYTGARDGGGTEVEP